MRRSYSAAGTFSLSLSRLDIEKPPGDIHRWRRTNLVVTGLWLLAFVQSPVKWLVEEDDSDKAHAVLQFWVAQDIARIAPYLMPFEIANALHRRVLRGELNVGDSTRMIARLLESRLELHQPPGLHVRALQLASQLNQSAAYDAHYLALAESAGCELWTADERFYRAASSGVDNVRWLGEFVAPE